MKNTELAAPHQIRFSLAFQQLLSGPENSRGSLLSLSLSPVDASPVHQVPQHLKLCLQDGMGICLHLSSERNDRHLKGQFQHLQPARKKADLIRFQRFTSQASLTEAEKNDLSPFSKSGREASLMRISSNNAKAWAKENLN